MFNICSAKPVGIEAIPVTVEIDVAAGIGVHLVGLGDAAVKESLLRIMTALMSIGYRVPGKKIVINLAPADTHKQGSGYDLPIAVGIIAATGQHDMPLAEKMVIMGELGLDASLRPVKAALPIVEMAVEQGFEGVILPVESALEASDFTQIKIYGARNLQEVIRILSGEGDTTEYLIWNTAEYIEAQMASKSLIRPVSVVDFAEIKGQAGAKRGMEIAAAGGHNLIMIGSPGSGKTSMAKALCGILPPMDTEESVVTSKIYSVAGIWSGGCGLIRQRPFRSPHCNISVSSLTGGGSGENILPGEVSLAHNGVLFLDEFTQMPKSVSEALRSPVEDRQVIVSRLRGKVTFPCSFMLVTAANPCPCGYFGEGDRCQCTPGQRMSYMAKLSGPLMDRIDIQLWLHPVQSEQLLSSREEEPSAEIAKRVMAARMVQKRRFAGEGIFCNAEMSSAHLKKFCRLSKDCTDALKTVMDRFGLSARACNRIIRISRTIADLAGSPDILVSHINEAAGLRFLDKRLL